MASASIFLEEEYSASATLPSTRPEIREVPAASSPRFSSPLNTLRVTLGARGGVGWVTARAMVLVLCIGDMHVPHRATDLPPKFKKLLVPGKIQHVLCTGDLCVKEAYDYLRGLCPNPGNVHVVQGVYDEMGVNNGGVAFPETKTVRVGAFTIGLIHGHQIVPWGDVDALAAVQRKMNADVLVVGHAPAGFASHKIEDRLILFPGSATGVKSFDDRQGGVGGNSVESGSKGTGGESNPNPSFVLMDVSGENLVAYVYELENGEVKVDKIEHSKRVEAGDT